MSTRANSYASNMAAASIGNHNDNDNNNILIRDAVVNLGGRIPGTYLARTLSNQDPNVNNNGGSSRKRIMDQLGLLEHLSAPSLNLSKRSLSETMSSLYAMMLIVTCLVFTCTEIVTSKVPLNYFESLGFYTYLYAVSVAFMLYLFCYVLRFTHGSNRLGIAIIIGGTVYDPPVNGVVNSAKPRSPIPPTTSMWKSLFAVWPRQQGSKSSLSPDRGLKI